MVFSRSGIFGLFLFVTDDGLAKLGVGSADLEFWSNLLYLHSSLRCDCRKFAGFWLCRWGAAASAPEPQRGQHAARQAHRRAHLPDCFDYFELEN